ncbi:MAG: hypothetical protein V1913_16185 [Fibrobacterota bacterium]
MRIISFIEQDEVIRRILTHCGLWKDPPARSQPAIPVPVEEPGHPKDGGDYMPDYTVFEDVRYPD